MVPGNRINESGGSRQGGGQGLGTGNNNMHGRLPDGTGGENRFRGGGC